MVEDFPAEVSGALAHMRLSGAVADEFVSSVRRLCRVSEGAQDLVVLWAEADVRGDTAERDSCADALMECILDRCRVPVA